jgi:O-antigen ligase
MKRFAAPGILKDISLTSFFLSLLALSLPWLTKASVPIIIISLISVSIESKLKIRNFKSQKILLLPIIFYLMHLTGMVNTGNMQEGWFDLEVKLSIILFPLLFLFKEKIHRKEFRLIFYGLAMGCLINALLSFGKGMAHYEANPVSVFESFSSYNFSYGLHPSYLSFYCSICAAFFLFSAVAALKMKTKFHWLYIAATLLFSLLTILHGSKSGVISLVVIFLFSIGYMIQIKTGKKIIAGFAITFILISLLTPVISPVMTARMLHAVKLRELKWSELESKYKHTKSSSEARLLIWNASWELLKENPTGAGTGDVKDVLMEKYRSEDMRGAYDLQLNCHNQFLQSGIGLGWIGVITLVLMLVVPLILKAKQGDIFSFTFLIVLNFNLAVESMLEKQAGVIFISFFYCLILAPRIPPDENILGC